MHQNSVIHTQIHRELPCQHPTHHSIISIINMIYSIIIHHIQSVPAVAQWFVSTHRLHLSSPSQSTISSKCEAIAIQIYWNYSIKMKGNRWNRAIIVVISLAKDLMTNVCWYRTQPTRDYTCKCYSEWILCMVCGIWCMNRLAWRTAVLVRYDDRHMMMRMQQQAIICTTYISAASESYNEFSTYVESARLSTHHHHHHHSTHTLVSRFPKSPPST